MDARPDEPREGTGRDRRTHVRAGSFSYARDHPRRGLDVLGLGLVVVTPALLVHAAGWPAVRQLGVAAHALAQLAHGRLDTVGLLEAATSAAWLTWGAMLVALPAEIRSLTRRTGHRSRTTPRRHTGRAGSRSPTTRSRSVQSRAGAPVGATAPGHLRPRAVTVGTRDGAAITASLGELAGIAVTGPGAPGLVCTLAAHVAECPGGEVLAEELFATPSLAEVTGVRHCAGPDALVRGVEAARIARTRDLVDVGATLIERDDEAAQADPAPLLVLVETVPEDARGRWTALIESASEVGIVVVFVADTPVATGRVLLDAHGVVVEAQPRPLADRFVGMCVAVSGCEGSDNRRSLRPAALDGPPPVRPSTLPTQPSSLHVTTEAAPCATAGAASGTLSLQPARPIVVTLLGSTTISAFGTPVREGLRGRAKALLAWHLVQPVGARVERAVEDLWPDLGGDQVLKQFWRALGDLRVGLRRSDHDNLDVLEKIGDCYRAKREEIACDLWTFDAALDDAARAGDDDARRRALSVAVDIFGGELLEGADAPWAEPARERVHRHSLQAHLRLAELEEAAGLMDAATATLERASTLDPHDEGTYRRLMTLQAAHGHPGAVAATWRRLCANLAELGAAPSRASTDLYGRLVP